MFKMEWASIYRTKEVWKFLTFFFFTPNINPTMLGWNISCFENSVDPDQLASKQQADQDLVFFYSACKYSKTCVKRPLKHRQNKNLNDKW